MRLAYISDYLPGYHSRSGGADWAAYRVGEALAKNNLSIDYFTRAPDKKGIEKKEDVHFAPILEDLLPKRAAEYSEVLKWYIWQADPLSFLYFLFAFFRRRPDIVHMHRFRCITMAPILAARVLSIPVYFSVYDYWMFCALETLVNEKNEVCRKFHGVWCYRCLPKKLVWAQRMFLVFRKNIFGRALRYIDKFIVLSRSSMEILKAYGIPEEKITVIPLPYGDRFEKLVATEAPVKNTLVYVGWIQKRKGLDVLLKALAEVKKEVPDVRLNVVGPEVKWEKDYRSYVDGLIEELGLSGNVAWQGPQPNESVQRFIRQSEMVVVPEQWENMSPVIVGEAMFNQRPVIGSRLGGMPDFIDDNKTGLLFDASSPPDLAKKILYLLKNKDISSDMGKRGRKSAEEIFSEGAVIKRYLDIYTN